MKLQMDKNKKCELRKYFTPLWACAAFIKAKQQPSHIHRKSCRSYTCTKTEYQYIQYSLYMKRTVVWSKEIQTIHSLLSFLGYCDLASFKKVHPENKKL